MPGKKLQVTGSGRCNITNDAVTAEKYTCADAAWMETLLSHFGVSDLLDMLQEIGIPVYKTFDGWYYPLSNSAQTVVDSFGWALQQAGVQTRFATQVQDIQQEKDGFSVTSVSPEGRRRDHFSQVIVAAGGKSFPSLGSRGEMFPILEHLGHTVLPKRPALAPVLADVSSVKALQGVRLDVGATLWEGSNRIAFAAGNLIFTQWGLNGPAVMDISHHISARPNAKMSITLNLLEFCKSAFDALLMQKRTTAIPLAVFLGAFFPPRVSDYYVQQVGLPSDVSLNQVDDKTLEKLVASLQETRLPVKGVKGFEFCQLSAGGVPVTQVHPQTLESKLVKGLYLTGETVDVVGPCGGYNLQYAFSSGALAGRAAATADQGIPGK